MSDLYSPLREHLRAGEWMLWEGQPEVRAFTMRGWYFIPFSLVWGGFAIFWETGVIQSNAPFFFRLWGIPFVLMGLYMIFGRFFVAAREARKTWYGVTNRRILLRHGISGQHFTEVDLDKIPSLQLTQGRDERGTISFGPRTPNDFFAIPGMPRQQSPVAGFWGATQPAPAPAFESIDHVRHVYETIKQAQRQLHEDWQRYNARQ